MPLIELSRKQKIAFCELAIRYYSICRCPQFTMCDIMLKLIEKFHKGVITHHEFYSLLKTAIPELWKYRPHDDYMLPWWELDSSGIAKRLRVLRDTLFELKN